MNTSFKILSILLVLLGLALATIGFVLMLSEPYGGTSTVHWVITFITLKFIGLLTIYLAYRIIKYLHKHHPFYYQERGVDLEDFDSSDDISSSNLITEQMHKMEEFNGDD